ncbi:MAG: hypothetical protein MMC23_002260 [Stictis urceolatum]|nr:hypothetical protein [Stictis urceolata]
MTPSIFPDDLRDLIEQARRIDEDCAPWADAQSAEWAFGEHISPTPAATAIDEPKTATTYNGVAHVYSSHTHAMTWNDYRTCRLVCNTVICRAGLLCKKYGTELPAAEAELLARSMKTVKYFVTEICASVPYFLDQDSLNFSRGEEGVDAHAGNKQSPGTNIKPRATAPMAVQLVMPLIVSLAACRDPVQLAWLRSRIKIVSRFTGSGVLEALAEVSRPGSILSLEFER